MRFPEGICSPPKALHPVFALSYNTTIEYQESLQKKNDHILSEALSYLETHLLKNGHDLMQLMCFVLAKYKLPKNEAFDIFFEKIQRQNNPFHKKYKRQNSTMETRFDDSSGRNIANYFVFAHTFFLKEETHRVKFTVNVGNFCNDAKKYLDIKLIVNKKARNMKIAEIQFYKNSNTNEIFFKHRYHFLGTGNESKPQYLFSLYNQLLSIIFEKNTDQRKEYSRTQKLDAIFLLVFLIGSNPAMLYEVNPENLKESRCTGGAFVTDALLQILLIKSGFQPARKNFLNIFEIELLFYLAVKSTKESKMSAFRKGARRAYYAALSNKTSFLFHQSDDINNNTLINIAFEITLKKNNNDSLFLLEHFLSPLFINKTYQEAFLNYFEKEKMSIRNAMMAFTARIIRSVIELKTVFKFKTLTKSEHDYLLRYLKGRMQRFNLNNQEIGYLCSEEFLKETTISENHHRQLKDFFAVSLFRQKKAEKVNENQYLQDVKRIGA